MTLQTPIGQISIYLDNEPIPFKIKQLPLNKEHISDINGRYSLTVEFENDSLTHSLKCMFDNYPTEEIKNSKESGEDFESLSFYYGKLKLTLGAEGENFNSGKFDYTISYLKNGLQYDINPKTASKSFLFGVAWIVNSNEKNEVQTWYAADPSLM
ncbi:MAG: hypothetical protein LBS74_02065 [Oscillospiraceae bacterium]|jgi:hypothetical protein|nr:hypothetical protein [Oscillospiraceae bacterium]